jgi:hypothetical protein
MVAKLKSNGRAKWEGKERFPPEALRKPGISLSPQEERRGERSTGANEGPEVLLIKGPRRGGERLAVGIFYKL